MTRTSRNRSPAFSGSSPQISIPLPSTAYWELIDEIRIRYLSFLPRDEAAKIIEASGGCITHPENDDIDWSTDEFIDDWNALHRGEEAIAR